MDRATSTIHTRRPGKKKGLTLLKSGRPPLLSAKLTSDTFSIPAGLPAAKSSKATRTLIRAHHNLQKARAKALLDDNQTLLAELDAQITELGGLGAYQTASLVGQSKDRGGDSSLWLVKWLEGYGLVGKPFQLTKDCGEAQKSLRVLEVGALSSRNAISAMEGKGVEIVKRIDLKSQEPSEIEEIDFMQFPIPIASKHKYDIISLSLVLNYVPDAAGRGNMLKRTTQFLRRQSNDHRAEGLPCIFVVLPLPCVANSRYLTVGHFHTIMSSLGYLSLKMHQSKKLYYGLFQWTDGDANSGSGRSFRKVEINPGKGRNNFCVTLNVT